MFVSSLSYQKHDFHFPFLFLCEGYLSEQTEGVSAHKRWAGLESEGEESSQTAGSLLCFDCFISDYLELASVFELCHVRFTWSQRAHLRGRSHQSRRTVRSQVSEGRNRSRTWHLESQLPSTSSEHNWNNTSPLVHTGSQCYWLLIIVWSITPLSQGEQ